MRSQRVADIKRYILDNQTITLEDICARFHISMSTLRRDLTEITSDGAIRKIYGGVTALNSKELMSFQDRFRTQIDAKTKIAQAAAEEIEDGDIVFIDSGTTTFHMIDYLKDKTSVTVITNNLEAIIRALPIRRLTVVSLPGILSRETLSFAGPEAAKTLEHFNIHKAFMASTGFSVEGGVTNSSPLESDIKRVAVQRSRKIYLLADRRKFGVASLVTYCALEKINTLVTDANPPDNIAAFLQRQNSKIVITE